MHAQPEKVVEIASGRMQNGYIATLIANKVDGEAADALELGQEEAAELPARP